MYKGERFDDENVELSFCWKNYYNIKMILEKVIKHELYKSFIFLSTYIDKLPIQITMIFEYYWNSIDEKTIYILEIGYQDEFFTELIKLK